MLTLFLFAVIVLLILAITEALVTWFLLVFGALILILGCTYLGRKLRKQWDEEDENYVH